MGIADWDKLHVKQAKTWRREAAAKLDRGVGVDGRALRPKKIPNGRPLGYGKTLRGIPGRIRRAKFRAFHSGFDVDLAKALKDTVFDRGSVRQVARRYVGFSRAQIQRNLKGLGDKIKKDGKKLGVFL